MASNYCTHCGASVMSGAQFCTQCGAKLAVARPQFSSAKSPVITLLLCIFLGIFGAHRFYVGKIGTGILMLLTGGGFGIWILVDLILIVTNKFEDSKGNELILTEHPSSLKKAMMIIGAVILGFLVYVLLILALVFYLTSGVVGTVRDQLYALRSGDIEKAYSYTSKDFQKVTSLEDFKSFLSQYPSLQNNESAFFNEREIEDNTGTVKGTLTAKDGAKTPITYRLIKEDGVWKILGITVQPTGAGAEIKYDNEVASSFTLPNIYVNRANRYSINYPENWEYEQIGKATVIFSGKKGTPAFYTTVNIQTILTKKDGGKYATVAEFMDGLKEQIMKNAADPKILNQGEMELPKNPERFHGQFLVFTYTYKGHAIKQMQVVILRDDKRAFYTWAYTAPAERYDKDLPVAKAMYESWDIK